MKAKFKNSPGIRNFVEVAPDRYAPIYCAQPYMDDVVGIDELITDISDEHFPKFKIGEVVKHIGIKGNTFGTICSITEFEWEDKDRRFQYLVDTILGKCAYIESDLHKLDEQEKLHYIWK